MLLRGRNHIFLSLFLLFSSSISLITAAQVHRKNLNKFNEAYIDLTGSASLDSYDAKKRVSSTESPTTVSQFLHEKKRLKLDNQTATNSTSIPSSSVLIAPSNTQFPDTTRTRDAAYFIEHGMVFHPDYLPTCPKSEIFRQPELLIKAETSIHDEIDSYRAELYANAMLRSLQQLK